MRMLNSCSPKVLSKSKNIVCCLLSCFNHAWLFVTPWTIAYQAPLSMGFSRQEYWSGLPCPPPGDLSDPGIKPSSLMSPTLAGRFLFSFLFFTTSTIVLNKHVVWKADIYAEGSELSLKFYSSNMKFHIGPVCFFCVLLILFILADLRKRIKWLVHMFIWRKRCEDI